MSRAFSQALGTRCHFVHPVRNINMNALLFSDGIRSHLISRDSPITFRQGVVSFSERGKFVKKSASACRVRWLVLFFSANKEQVLTSDYNAGRSPDEDQKDLVT